VAELALVPESASVSDVRRQRDYWLGTTLFKMRRRYADAGKLLLGVAPHLGQDGAEAMFHGARALSRADDDERAIVWYRKVVAKYPRTEWAQEAQFLIGWLELNRGRYAESIEPLEQVLARYPRSKWVDDALWFLGPGALPQRPLGQGPDAARAAGQARRLAGGRQGAILAGPHR
jgi:soluble lytic murein transglycosylase